MRTVDVETGPAVMQTTDVDATSGPARISFGHAQRNTEKAEDVWYAVCPPRSSDGKLPPAGFAIFDGHGGRTAAESCCASVLDRLLVGKEPFAQAAISDAFWRADEELGLAGVTSGTTATILLAKPEEDAGQERLGCTLAWVGDSQAICVDMLEKGDTPLVSTTPHLPDNESEVSRMELQWALRKHVHGSSKWNSAESRMVDRDLRKAKSTGCHAQPKPSPPPATEAERTSEEERSATAIQALFRGQRCRRQRDDAERSKEISDAVLAVSGKTPSNDEIVMLDRVLSRGALMNAMMTSSAYALDPSLEARLSSPL